MVYVLNVNKKPLMPCTKAKARKLLKKNKAKIVKYTPFTIQLLFECENKVQSINLGVDAGSKVIGLSASTKDKELCSSEIELRDDISNLLATRRQNRRTRRNRLRYRKPRFDNRTKRKKKGWLAPSIEHKIKSHFGAIRDVYKILPIDKIKVGYDNKDYFIFGRRATGYFDIRNLYGDKVNKGSLSYKKLDLLETRKTILIERRQSVSSPQ